MATGVKDARDRFYVALVELGQLVDRHVGRRELAPAPAET